MILFRRIHFESKTKRLPIPYSQSRFHVFVVSCFATEAMSKLTMLVPRGLELLDPPRVDEEEEGHAGEKADAPDEAAETGEVREVEHGVDDAGGEEHDAQARHDQDVGILHQSDPSVCGGVSGGVDDDDDDELAKREIMERSCRDHGEIMGREFMDQQQYRWEWSLCAATHRRGDDDTCGKDREGLDRVLVGSNGSLAPSSELLLLASWVLWRRW
eukprot:TRINITY_DN1498_c0_g1_i2.p1 TRINITY_DN1498_c0_g1~~TRINITY_DN1498_c0_g1_i2.p1  ORF type:complete len:215 (-),score=34.71 TRINITY_DN1498_c0_g1_i2:554-1198(-)